jgi:hypothetical protein
MNKAITDGLVLMPPPFAGGLAVWSAGDGTPGSETYATTGNGVFVPADQDFAGCLELLKTQSVTKLRHMGETTLLPGCYLRISTRVKAVSGELPGVRIAGWAGGARGAHVAGLTEYAPTVQLTSYGEVVEISAIVGSGNRLGVDMVWPSAIYGHFGLDLTGGNGSVVRVDDFAIEDVTNVFIRDMMGVVDVRDYGAKGDGITDDSAAFEAADADANGREVLVSAGVYYLGNHVTIENQIRFEGAITMPDDKRFVFQKNFDYPTYVDAFGDEELAFKKAFQALLNFSDHESLDLCGRRIAVSAPIDMQVAEGSKTVFAIRRVIRNGQFQPQDGPAWDPTVVTTTANYSAADPLRLSNVANIAQISVGSLVEGAGVGREIYVRAVDTVTNTVTLSQELYGAAANQSFTFTRFKYLLDFSGFDDLAQFIIDDVEFLCDGTASGIMLAKEGLTFHLRDCFINKPRDRGLTSSGGGCQGMMIDRCQIVSNEQNLPVEDRTTVGFNANANDVKIRDNRAVRFKHFAVLAGTGNLITGNHWFHGDNTGLGVRKAGIVFTTPNCKSVVTGNYIDNNFIEWTNEHDATPELGAQYSFGGLTITGNIFTAADVAPWFTWIVVKPYGSGHYIHGFSVTGNVFRAIGGSVDRVESVDTAFADLDHGRARTIVFAANTFTAVNNIAVNPVSVVHAQATAAQTWVVEAAPYLPFGGRARNLEAVCPDGKLTDANGVAVFELPYAEPEKGAAKTQANLIFKTACKGSVRVTFRTDNPL